jgi:hypothetical protein
MKVWPFNMMEKKVWSKYFRLFFYSFKLGSALTKHFLVFKEFIRKFAAQSTYLKLNWTPYISIFYWQLVDFIITMGSEIWWYVKVRVTTRFFHCEVLEVFEYCWQLTPGENLALKNVCIIFDSSHGAVLAYLSNKLCVTSATYITN